MNNYFMFLGTLAVFAATAFGGSRDGAGGLVELPIPEINFGYHCNLVLENPSADPIRWRSTGEMDISKEQITKSGENLEIPKDAWKTHGTFDVRIPKNAVLPSKELPPYNLEGHFLAFSFNKQDTWLVSLRTNVIFEPRVAGAAAFVLADFESNVLGARIMAGDTRKGHEGQSLDLQVKCRLLK